MQQHAESGYAGTVEAEIGSMQREREVASTVSHEQPAGVASASQLGFELMDEMIDAFVESQKGAQPGAWERWSLVVGLFGAGFGLLLGALLGGRAGVWVATLGLTVEIVGFGTSLTFMVKREWQSFRRARRTYARDLDKDFQAYQAYVAELRRYPKVERDKRLRYIQDRRRVMHQRLGLFSGGIERLGVLPVLVVLYLQFRDWRWGDWSMLADVNLVQGLLIWALLLAYVLGWHLVWLSARAEAYELLLAEAAQQDTEWDDVRG